MYSICIICSISIIGAFATFNKGVISMDYVENEHRHICTGRCLSWSGIIAGAFVAIGLGFLFDVFGLAIGLSAFTTDSSGLAAIAIGGFIGLLIAAVVTTFVGGWVAGFLGNYFNSNLPLHNNRIGALHGFVSWCLALILMVFIMTGINDFIFHFQDTMVNPHASVSRESVSPSPASAMASRVNLGHPGAPTVNATPREEKATNIVGMTLFAMFILFFVGAVSATLGGLYGYKPRDDMDDVVVTTKRKKTTV